LNFYCSSFHTEYDHSNDYYHHDPSGAKSSFLPTYGTYYGQDSWGECAIPVINRFTMPSAPENHDNSPFWYSINVGSAHFLIYSAEHNFTQGSEQWNWMYSDLSRVNRATQPWLIIAGHRPMYSSQDRPDYRAAKAAQLQALQPLMNKFKVDLSFYGHLHAYERDCAAYTDPKGNIVCLDNSKNKGNWGTINILIGSAGYRLDVCKYNHTSYAEYYSNSEWGHSILSWNKSSLHFEYRRNKDNFVLDKLDLQK
jgi:hypothetical protein